MGRVPGRYDPMDRAMKHHKTPGSTLLYTDFTFVSQGIALHLRGARVKVCGSSVYVSTGTEQQSCLFEQIDTNPVHTSS
jgi:hypothetical protein